MSKHTPGPWAWIDNNNLLVSNPTKFTHPFKYDHLIGAEVYSTYDKKLIAAAPELLEALKDALEFIRPQYGYDCRLADLLKRADAAIAKATSSGGAAE